MDSRALARAAGRPADPRRCADSLPGCSGPTARRGRSRRRLCRHSAGGGASPRRRRPNRWAGLPPCAHDGTERRIVCPQDPAEQTACYSGKKKDHTVKNVLLVNALLVILFLSDTHGGRVHDLRIAEATPYPPSWRRVL